MGEGLGGWGAHHPTCNHNVRSTGRFQTETNFSDRAAPQQLVLTYFTTFSPLVPNFTTSWLTSISPQYSDTSPL
jgi:hypothetical protein